MQIYEIKKLYWEIINEVRTWNTHIIFAIPGKTGAYFRHKYAKKNFKKFGDVIPWVSTGITIRNPQNLSIGDKVGFSKNVFINAGGGVTIGDHVIIGPDTKIWSINHKFHDIDAPVNDQGWSPGPVVIEDLVWIGAGVIVLPNVVIGKGSIIGAGAVVSKKIEPYSIVVGNPGKVVGSRKS